MLESLFPRRSPMRSVLESAYTGAVARSLRRDRFASRLVELVQNIVCLRLAWRDNDLPNRTRNCAAAIAVTPSQLLLAHAPPPIAWSFAGQLSEQLLLRLPQR